MNSKVILAIFLLFSLVISEDCSNFNGENACQGQQTYYPDDWAQRSFQTPKMGDADYEDYHEGYARIMCFSAPKYYQDLTKADISIECRVHPDIDQSSLSYVINGQRQTSSIYNASSSKDTQPLKISISGVGKDGMTYSINLDDVDLLWNNAPIIQAANYKNGQKGGIIELFGWPYEDIKEECPSLAKMGWMGVKVFPPQESVMTNIWIQNGEINPWWFLYQPVSYRLHGRHGTRDQLRDMIQTCRKAGVRVYADAVVNHMTGGGNDQWKDHRNSAGSSCAHWGPKNSTGNSPYFTHSFMYLKSNNTGLPPGNEFPGVPYIATDFHCERSLNSWSDPFQLNFGWLTGLADLNTESPYVQRRIAAYFTDLLGIGFSGFRMDAAKHIQPSDLTAILKTFRNDFLPGAFPDDFITYLEVIVGGEKDLLFCQDNFYNFGASFAKLLSGAGISDADVAKIKIWESDYPKEFPICGYWPIPSERYVAQNDCHDDQNPGSSSRDMGDYGSVLIKEKDVNKHRQFEIQLFTRTDGNWQIKLVLSSYSFMNNGAQGIPDGKSDCKTCEGPYCNQCTKSMAYSKAHDPNACGYTSSVNGQWIEGVYTRVHRDYSIIQAMRNWMGLPKVTNPTDLGLPSNCGAQQQIE